MKISKKDFELFKTECQKWVQKLGLTDWNITFRHRPLINAQAHTQYDCNASSACFSLRTECDKPEKEAFTSSIEDSAKHEVLHLLLARLYFKAGARYLNEGELDEAEHAVIARLTKAL